MPGSKAERKRFSQFSLGIGLEKKYSCGACGGTQKCKSCIDSGPLQNGQEFSIHRTYLLKEKNEKYFN